MIGMEHAPGIMVLTLQDLFRLSKAYSVRHGLTYKVGSCRALASQANRAYLRLVQRATTTPAWPAACSPYRLSHHLLFSSPWLPACVSACR